MKKYIVLGALLLSVTFVSAATVYTTYTTRSGDTLQSVASANGTTTAAIVAMNPNIKLQRGQTLNVGYTVTTPPTPTPTPTGNEIVFNAYLTGYTYWDNTPPGSADIALPVIHSKAGGTGTYADPITLAVGHVISGGKDTPDYPAGTKFYVPDLKRYFIVEDLCGDGNQPQNGPCHKNTDVPGVVWLDLWLGGSTGTRSSTNTCAENLTRVYSVIQNPVATYAVTQGAIYENGCK